MIYNLLKMHIYIIVNRFNIRFRLVYKILKIIINDFINLPKIDIASCFIDTLLKGRYTALGVCPRHLKYSANRISVFCHVSALSFVSWA